MKLNNYIYTITATSDGGCVIGGTVCDYQNNIPGDVDLWIKKVLAESIITHAEETPDPTDSDIAIYPNPGKDYFFINTIRKNLIVKLFTNSGIPVIQKKITDFPVCKINTSGLVKGSYTYRIWDKKKKIVIESGTWIKN